MIPSALSTDSFTKFPSFAEVSHREAMVVETMGRSSEPHPQVGRRKPAQPETGKEQKEEKYSSPL